MFARKWPALVFCALTGGITAAHAQTPTYAWALSGADADSARLPLSAESTSYKGQPAETGPIAQALINNSLTDGADKQFTDSPVRASDAEVADSTRTVPTAIPEPRGFAFGGVGLILVGAFVTYRSHRRRQRGF